MTSMAPSPDSRPEDSGRPDAGVHSPMEAFSSFRGMNWSPASLAFHQNLEQFADRVGLIVGLQGNGKISQEDAYQQIKMLLKELKHSRRNLLE